MDTDELEEQIKSQVSEWASNSNECFVLEVLHGDEATTFQPEFTYPIFGEGESIFGYQDLEITLTFASHNLKPHLAVEYAKKFPAAGDVKPTDIHDALRDFLPEVAFSTQPVGEALIDETAGSFVPPGEKVHQYSRDGERFEVWCSNLSDPAARRLLENMQILMPMFIEGGSKLELEQDWTAQRWKLFLLYSVQPKADAGPTYSPYSLVGYGTSYRVFTFPDRTDSPDAGFAGFTGPTQSLEDLLPAQVAGASDNATTAQATTTQSPLDLPSRERLSQFLILPPHQGNGHGQELYGVMYRTLSAPSNVLEFTVEDPNEAFDDLRDLCDLIYLRAHDSDFAALSINTNIPSDKLKAEQELPVGLIVPEATRNAIMKRTKLMQRQFDRLVEMHTLSFIPPVNRSRSRITKRDKAPNEKDRAYYLWRLYVKQRLYVFNRDQLAQLERQERIEKLESTLDAVQEAYSEMIEKVQKRERQIKKDMANGNGSPMDVEGANHSAGTPKPRPKRKILEDDEDEEIDGQGTAVDGHGRKKAKT